MYSVSKIPLSADIALAIVRQHIGQSVSIVHFEELHEGFFNSAARMELSNGIQCVLKAAPPPDVQVLRYERDIMRAEVEAMRLVRARTEIPVPEIFCYDSSHTLLPSDFFLMQLLPDIPYHKLRKDLSPEAQAVIDQEMGRYTRIMSEITNDRFGYWSQPEEAGVSWRECFDRMVQGVLADGQAIGVAFPWTYDAIYGQLRNHYSVLEEVTTPRLVHWDLWDGNIFVDPNGPRISGVIDFERVLWADPLMEVGFAWMDVDSSFVKGYGGALAGESEKIRRLLYNGYLYLIMVIETYYRHFPTKDQENWARGRLEDTLNQLK